MKPEFTPEELQFILVVMMKADPLDTIMEARTIKRKIQDSAASQQPVGRQEPKP